MRPRALTARQQIFVSAAGPAVGIAIGGGVLVLWLSGVLAGAPPQVLRVVEFIVWVNLGWAVLNLLPILPMDGGHIAASLAEMVAGRNGRVAARVLSIVLTVLIGLWALATMQLWILILCALFTYVNVQALRAEAAARGSSGPLE